MGNTQIKKKAKNTNYYHKIFYITFKQFIEGVKDETRERERK